MTNNQKGFIDILLLGVVIVLFGIVGYFALSKKSHYVECKPSDLNDCAKYDSKLDVRNWKTYANTQYGYELKYPVEWTDNKCYGENVDPEIFNIIYKQEEYICFKSPMPGNISISVSKDNSPRDTPLLFKDFVKAYINKGPKDDIKIIDTQFKIDGREAIKIIAPQPTDYSNITILINYSPDSFLAIDVFYLPVNKDYIVNTLDQILSTLKFTK